MAPPVHTITHHMAPSCRTLSQDLMSSYYKDYVKKILKKKKPSKTRSATVATGN